VGYDQDGSVFGKKRVVDIIEKNKLAVKKGNAHSLMHTSTGAASVEGYNKAAMHDSASDMTHSVTNCSKNNRESDFIMAQGPPKIPANLTTVNKRGRKGKLLPSLMDDSGVSPSGVQQLSSELSRFARKGKGRGGDSMQTGYETEATAGNDHFRFHSTYDDGFARNNGVFDSINDIGTFSTGHQPGRVNYNQSQGFYDGPKKRKSAYKTKSLSTASYGQTRRAPNHKSFI